jgi:hypothetical protein
MALYLLLIGLTNTVKGGEDMGFLSLFIKGKILQSLLGGSGRRGVGSVGGRVLGTPMRKAAIAAITAMLVRRAFRRR